MQLRITEQEDGGRVVLAVSGEVDIATAPSLRQRLLAAVEGGARQVVVDLADVEFMDSTGLGVLVGGLKRLRSNGGSLVVVLPEGSVRKIFEVTGLLDVFGVVDSLDEVPAPS